VKARPRHTLLAVGDLKRALRFYRTAFEWPELAQKPGYAELDLGNGGRLALVERPAQPSELALDVEDVTVAAHRLVAAGARLVAPIANSGSADERAVVADPWGNQLALARGETVDDVERLRAVALRWIKLWQGGDHADFYLVHDPAFVDGTPAGRTPNVEGFRQGLRELYTMFPDFDLVAWDLVVDAAQRKVAIRWSATGTHAAEMLGIPATGRKVIFRGIEIVRIERDRIVERWGEWDSIAVLHQLGAAPAIRSK
jgi:steroid delta-isomerase-like uncharacterized protein